MDYTSANLNPKCVYNRAMQARPDYLVLGHVSKDLLPGGGARAGGTVTYASITAQRLGLQAAMVTALSTDDDGLLDQAREAGAWVCAVDSGGTTTFENVYDEDGRRTQRIGSPARAIQWSDVPVAWRGAPIVHLGPVAQELSADMSAMFPYSLLGITPQGWMRSWNAEGHVAQTAWPVPGALANLPPGSCLILSMEDLGWDYGLVEQYSRLAHVVAITRSEDGAFIFVPVAEVVDYIPEQGGSRGSLTAPGDRTEIVVPAVASRSVDLTGAGDVFAAAFLVRYYETRNSIVAARFAHAAAACAIEGLGAEGIPTREQLSMRLGSAP